MLPIPPTTTVHVAPMRDVDIDARAAFVGALVLGAVGVSLAVCGGPMDPAALIMGAAGLLLAAGGNEARAALQATADDRRPQAYARAWCSAIWSVRQEIAADAWIQPSADTSVVAIGGACVQQVRRLVVLRRTQRRARRR